MKGRCKHDERCKHGYISEGTMKARNHTWKDDANKKKHVKGPYKHEHNLNTLKPQNEPVKGRNTHHLYIATTRNGVIKTSHECSETIDNGESTCLLYLCVCHMCVNHVNVVDMEKSVGRS